MASKGGLAWLHASMSRMSNSSDQDCWSRGMCSASKVHQIFWVNFDHHFAGHPVAKLKLNLERRSMCKLQHINTQHGNWCL
jgi:hypothetical protein